MNRHKKLYELYFKELLFSLVLFSFIGLASCTYGLKKVPSNSTLNTPQGGRLYKCSFVSAYQASLATYQVQMVTGDRIKTEGTIQVLLRETSDQENYWTFEVKDSQNPKWGALFRFYKLKEVPKIASVFSGTQWEPHPFYLEIIWIDSNKSPLKVYFKNDVDGPNRDLIVEGMTILSKGVDILSLPTFARAVNPFLRAPGISTLYLDHESLEEVVEIFEGKLKKSEEICRMSVHKGSKGDIFKIRIQPGRSGQGLTLGAFLLIPFPYTNMDSCREFKIGTKAEFIHGTNSFKLYEDFDIKACPAGNPQNPFEDHVTQKIVATQKSGWLVSSILHCPFTAGTLFQSQSITFCGTNLKATNKLVQSGTMGLILTVLNIENQKIECEDIKLTAIQKSGQ